MSSESTQISAYISRETKARLERYARSRGLKQAYLIESALLHHFQALDELPVDVVIPPRLVDTRESGQRVLERLNMPQQPTETMAALFKDD